MERRVLDAIKVELEKQGCKYFTEHDGFRTDQPVDLEAVSDGVKAHAGFAIRIVAK